MASSEMVGVMVCPLCKQDGATVHEQRTGTKKGRLYYRCYTEVGGSAMRCGTIQCIGPEGQEVIKRAMRPIGEPKADTVEKVEPGPIGEDFVPELETVPGDGAIEQAKAPVKKQQSVLDWFLNGDDENE